MEDLIRSVEEKAQLLRDLRPLSEEVIRSLQKFYDVELTFTSNAIEGNTLTLRETAEVIEHGITVGGKSLKHHLEAVDHYDALIWVREFVSRNLPADESFVQDLHRRIVARSEPDIAGRYSPHRRRVVGSPVVFPNPIKVPELMNEFGKWLELVPSEPESAFDAHLRLVTIHPFGDGNGRTARLLMNTILLRGGYPPIAVRPEDRGQYLDAVQTAQLTGNNIPFDRLMYGRLDSTLGEYLNAVKESVPEAAPRPPRLAGPGD